MIGEYLGNISNDFHNQVLSHYVDLFDLSNMGFDQALRYFLASFRLPGEVSECVLLLRCARVFARVLIIKFKPIRFNNPFQF